LCLPHHSEPNTAFAEHCSPVNCFPRILAHFLWVIPTLVYIFSIRKYPDHLS
jgi:hypothetical protein